MSPGSIALTQRQKQIQEAERLAQRLYIFALGRHNAEPEGADKKLWWVVMASASEAHVALRDGRGAPGTKVPPGQGWPEADELPLETDAQQVPPKLALELAQSLKPLFIPLNKEHFWAFKNGTKPRGPEGFMEEYRRNGIRWNAATCLIGRRVVLSLGYGKAERIHTHVQSFRVSTEPTESAAWLAIYGKGGVAACIGMADIQGLLAERP